MALLSYGQQLEEVQAAISAIQSGSQEYQLGSASGGRRLRRADLDALHEREQWLTDKLESVGDIIPGSTITRQVTPVGFK
ncbi:MAG: hypothetical protein DRN01_06975 [Thermoplasmata archaeon]|nr:MAG: hypothetical protein DRN01_06975 [Thermoplasmata archaeon]